MTITRDKIDQAIQLKKWFAEQLAETCPNDPDLGLDYNQQNPEERIQQIAAFEETDKHNLFKEFLEELSENELRDLQAIGFYGRGQHENFDLALEEADQMEQDAADVAYTMQLLAADDYLEAGFDKLNQRHEI
jgi:hypothetical protein